MGTFSSACQLVVSVCDCGIIVHGRAAVKRNANTKHSPAIHFATDAISRRCASWSVAVAQKYCMDAVFVIVLRYG